jgi:hypothetical protein
VVGKNGNWHVGGNDTELISGWYGAGRCKMGCSPAEGQAGKGGGARDAPLIVRAKFMSYSLQRVQWISMVLLARQGMARGKGWRLKLPNLPN